MITKLHELDKLYSNKITTVIINKWDKIMENSDLAQKTGVAFITPKYQQQYIAILKKQYKGNTQEFIDRLEKEKNKRSFRIRIMPVWFTSFAFIVFTIYIGTNNIYINFIGAYISLWFFQIIYMKLVNQRFGDFCSEIKMIYPNINRNKNYQKKTNIKIKNKSVKFSIKDFVTIEYALWASNEDTDIINFDHKNWPFISKQIYDKWKINNDPSKDTCLKILNKSKDKNFPISLYNLKETNSKIESNKRLIDNILDYFEENGLLKAKRWLEDRY
jgi:curved DNA-binding protein CbpA